MKWNRQKIWFLSMFTLMIALSAYYLLSEDSSKQIDAPQAVETSDDAGDGEDIGAKVSDPTEVTDEQVLEQLQSGDGAAIDFFAETHLQQQDELALETEKYMKIITDPDASTQAISSAMTAMEELEDRNEKVTELQEKLQQHFADVVVQEKDEQWRVIVQSEALNREQAVQIVQLVTEHLRIRPEQVSVQYRP